MKVPFIILYIACIQVNNCGKNTTSGSDSIKNDLQIGNLKGKIKSVEIINPENAQYIEGDDDYIENSIPVESYKYNNMGYLTESVKYEDGQGRLQESYKYDTENNLIEYIRHPNPYGYGYSKKTYQYDNKGNKVKGVINDLAEGINHTLTYQYNDQSLIEKISYSSDSITYDATIYNYDDENNKIGIVSFYSDGRIKQSDSLKKDDKGNRIEVVSYGRGRKYQLKYNNKDNLIEIIYYDWNGELSYKEAYQYNDAGNKVKMTHLIYPYMDEINKIYKYDTKNNQIEMIETNYKGEINLETNKYKYDSEGNWTQKSASWNTEQPFNVVKRTIEYYE